MLIKHYYVKLKYNINIDNIATLKPHELHKQNEKILIDVT